MMHAVPDRPETWGSLKPELRASWQRSAQFLQDPGGAFAPVDISDADLSAYRRAHPLSRVLPIFQRLLIQPAADAGLIVALGDDLGRLLWVDGDRQALRRAESAAFQSGATWSEQAIGTSAPGVALATGTGVQVHRQEHYAYSAHHFSCSAAPIRHPRTGKILGVVDLTGGDKAVATHSLALIYAAVSAAEAELTLLPEDSCKAQLTTLGTARPHIGLPTAREALRVRHAEILALLSWHAATGHGGMSASELAEMLFGEPGHEVALRAEMVRLRRVLKSTPASGGAHLESKPYRLSASLQFDGLTVLKALTAGDRQTALDVYGGQLLPTSEAPGIVQLRRSLGLNLREAVIADGSPEELWQYLQLPEATDDEHAIYTALRILPSDSPQRAALVTRLQR